MSTRTLLVELSHETVFERFKRAAKDNPDFTAYECMMLTAADLGIPSGFVGEACAVVHAMNAARKQFEKNEA